MRDEAAALFDAEDLVQRATRGAERARGAVQSRGEADDQGDDRGAALLLRGFERAGHGVDGVGGCAGVAQIARRRR